VNGFANVVLTTGSAGIPGVLAHFSALFAHRAAAAFLAISFRRAAVRLAARAGPPALPPSLAILAISSGPAVAARLLPKATACGFFLSLMAESIAP